MDAQGEPTLVLLRTKTRNKLRDFVYKHTGRFWRKREVVRYTVCTILISMLLQGAGQALCVWQQRTEAICFLDVGQGDGILIRSPDGRNIVIDGGSTSQSKCGTYTLLPALRSQGMTEIDCWFVTHTDEDHISGLKELLSQGKLTQIKGRHDPIIGPRAVVVVESMCAITVLDLLMQNATAKLDNLKRIYRS